MHCRVGPRSFVLLSGLRSSVSAYATDATATAQTHLFSLAGLPSRSAHISALGNLQGEEFLAAARTKRWWMGPSFGQKGAGVPTETQFLLVKLAKDAYAVMLPLVADGLRCTLRGSEDRNKSLLFAQMDSGDTQHTFTGMEPFMVVSVSESPFDAIKDAMSRAARQLATFELASEKRVSSDINLFGWCTWDAFYQHVDAAGVRSGLASLLSAGTPAKMLILDDGWQSVQDDEQETAEKPEQEEGVLNDPAQGEGKSLWEEMVASCYRNFVHNARHNAAQLHVWRWAAKTVLRKPLGQFFAENTPFTKRLSSFEANEKFEDKAKGTTLKALVRDLRETFGLRSVYCWHTLGGYWGGVSTTSEQMAHLQPRRTMPKPARSLLEVEPALAWDAAALRGVGQIPANKIREFFHGLHGYLADAGVDGVKVDGQSGMGPFGGAALVRTMVHEMERSVAKHFGNRCINCMCHSSENLFSYRSTAVVRAADDFYPRELLSQPVHLLNVAYNSLFLSHVGAPDWDMFQSSHADAALHAAARAVGGCPVYVSDKPGEHNAELLRKLVLPDGTILRCVDAGRPTKDVLFADANADGRTALKIFNKNARTAVVGAFNVQGAQWDRESRQFVEVPEAMREVRFEVKAQDVDGWSAAADAAHMRDAYVVMSHRDGKLRRMGNDEALPCSLEPRQWEIFTFAHIQHLEGIEWAALGLSEMLNGGGAVVESTLYASHAFVEAPEATLAPAAAPATTTTTIATTAFTQAAQAAQTALAATTATAAMATAATSSAAVMNADAVDTAAARASVVASVVLRASGRFVAYCSQRPRSVTSGEAQLAFEWDGHVLSVPFERGAAQTQLLISF